MHIKTHSWSFIEDFVSKHQNTTVLRTSVWNYDYRKLGKFWYVASHSTAYLKKEVIFLNEIAININLNFFSV